MTPVLQLILGGQDIMARLAPYLISVTLTDEAGGDNDTLSIELDDYMRQIPLPREDDVLVLMAGYRETGIAMMGQFQVQGWESGWEPDGPERITINARSASYSGEAKAGSRKHYDRKKVREIADDAAKAAGLELSIDPEIGDLEIEYAVRWEASPIDFVVRLVEEAGGLVKAGGGKLAVVKRGAGKGAGGAELPPIIVTRAGSAGWSISGEPRPRHGAVEASWHDPKDGKRKTVKHATGAAGPTHAIIHPRASENEAAAAAEARARQLTMLTGSGHFIAPFDPARSAGAHVIASGFGAGIDGQWNSTSIETTWDQGSAVLSTINVEAPAEGKGG